MAGAAKSGDAQLRALADIFRLDDMNSAERGRGAKKVNLPPASAQTPANVHTFAGGFSAAIDPARGAQCVPTANKIDYRIKAGTDAKLGSGALGLPSVQSNTAIEGSYAGGRK